MSKSFQIDTEKLQNIIDHFTTQAQAVKAILDRLADEAAALRDSGWSGAQAAQFYARLDGEIFPRLNKLHGGLDGSAQALDQFLSQMVAIEPALDKLQQQLPVIEAARRKIEARIKQLEDQDPDEMIRAFEAFLAAREQAGDNGHSARPGQPGEAKQ
jgi:WXG100 family type VII secretion target